MFDPLNQTSKVEHVPSTEGFIKWVEGKPSDEAYDWNCPFTCAIAQYGSQFGMSFSATHHFLGMDVIRATIASPWTFGELLSRLKDG